MALYDVLKDRNSVNILKQLYSQEVVLKIGYTMKLSDLKKKVSAEGSISLFNSAETLAKHGLASMEMVESDYVLSITQKGKHFIEVFDQLIDLFSVAKPAGGAGGVKIKYNLIEMERNIMVLVYKITKETGKGVDMKTLVSELYPYQDYKARVGAVSRYVNKLADLKLIEKTKDGRSHKLKLTNTGFKVMNEQFLKVLA